MSSSTPQQHSAAAVPPPTDAAAFHAQPPSSSSASASTSSVALTTAQNFLEDILRFLSNALLSEEGADLGGSTHAANPNAIDTSADSSSATLRLLRGKGGGGFSPGARIMLAGFGIVFSLGFCYIMRHRVTQWASDYFEPPVDIRQVRAQHAKTANDKMADAIRAGASSRVRPLDNDLEMGGPLSSQYGGRGLYAPDALRAYAIAKQKAPPPSPPKKRKNVVM
ncbi:unnamed protein product [Amoebophrya sp. A25]|nr:unnamed protein product [Amoebophrya sp. A25]|eukprot:GSA25T00009226001.1